MLDLVENPNCWFFHAQAHINSFHSAWFQKVFSLIIFARKVEIQTLYQRFSVVPKMCDFYQKQKTRNCSAENILHSIQIRFVKIKFISEQQLVGNGFSKVVVHIIRDSNESDSYLY